ncbi:MAG: adenylate/guanylate cyclase protein [Actinomycetota bacterium]|nr:adenylate/guanylate cyclase protein [Actinomycetota bacterium]
MSSPSGAADGGNGRVSDLAVFGSPGPLEHTGSFARPTAFDPEPGTPANNLQLRLLGGPRRWRRREVARAVGVSLLSARKLWRALGFANVTDADVAFTDADAEALSRVANLVREGLIDEPTATVLARALGQTTDRLVSWHTEALMDHLSNTVGNREGKNPEILVEQLGQLAGELEQLLVYSWRRQFAAVVARIAETPNGAGNVSSGVLTVGFADLVSYTRLSQRLQQRDLGILVQRFEGLASDVVTAGGGRVIKTVGDEVLFTADDAVSGAVIALSLSEQMAVDDVVPDVRVGLAHGLVLRSLGDVYGPTVNLASRLTGLAQPGTVITDPSTGAALARNPDLVLVPQRARQIRGIGQLQPLLVARATPNAPLIDLD